MKYNGHHDVYSWIAAHKQAAAELRAVRRRNRALLALALLLACAVLISVIA